MSRKTVISGIGLISPLGSDLDPFWKRIASGESAVRKIESFDASPFSSQIAAQVVEFNVDDYLSKKDQRRMDPFCHYAIAGARRAMADSGLDMNAEDPNREYARIITEEVGRMEGIIHDLLDFIRPRKQTRKMLAIDELVLGTVSRFQGELDQQGLGLNYCLQAEAAEVSCNPGEIQQVLQNFLINAIQVLPTGGEVEVRTSLLEGGVKVEVLDNGPGFAEDVADKLFSPFFSTKATGSGLGLTISAQIIKAHGGVPGAENRESGGANFFFILPLPKSEGGE